MRRLSSALAPLACIAAGLSSAAVAFGQNPPPPTPAELFTKAINEVILLHNSDDSARVIAPDRLRSGIDPKNAHGLTGGLSTASVKFGDIKLFNQNKRTVAASNDGMYCGGLILQVLYSCYGQAIGQTDGSDENDSNKQPLPWEKAAVDPLLAIWYLDTDDAQTIDSDNHRGIVRAIEKAGMAAGAPDCKADYVKDLGTVSSFDDAKTKLQTLAPGSFLQMWLPPDPSLQRSMAHAALFVGYHVVGIPDPSDSTKLRLYGRVYYWSSNYQNVAAGTPTWDNNTTLLTADWTAAHILPDDERRVGISYCDLRTAAMLSQSEAASKGVVTADRPRSVESLYAAAINVHKP